MHHELKTWPEPFQAIWDGLKSYEIREDDRKFAVGDSLALKEFAPHKPCAGTGRVWDNGDKTDCGCSKPHGDYTGRFIEAEVTYKTDGGEWGLPDELCVLGIKVHAKSTYKDNTASFQLDAPLPPTAPFACTKTTGIPCYDKATPNEPLFVLRAQDKTAPDVVLEWIRLNPDAPEAKLRSAFESVTAMRTWSTRKAAD